MKLGLDVAQHQQTWDELLSRVRFAEEAGFDGAWTFDHFKALYGDPSGPALEAWTLLAALAASTHRIRLGPLVTGITYRHPATLAAQAVTVDHVSGGRLEFAVGAAWHEQEHRELGFHFPSVKGRAERLEEAVQLMRLLMTEDGASFEGKHYRLEDATYRPRPVQQPHPPIWIGARGEQLMLPIVGRQADVWHAEGRAENLKRKWEVVAEYAEKAGRDPAGIVRASDLSISEDWDEVRAQAESLREIGVTYLNVSWPGQGRGRVEEFMDRIGNELMD
jgi:F420-dependent oxidoreductase-like protein